MDVLTPEQRHKCMSNIHSTDTKPEIMLRKALWHSGIRYRKNYKKLPGKPDIAITKYKIAVFCDGEFWHGKDWNSKQGQIQTHCEYWIPKIERNINRDNMTDKHLNNQGWVVLRFWGKDIQKNLVACVEEVKDMIFQVKIGSPAIWDNYYNLEELYESEGLMVAEPEVEYGGQQNNT
jgi:DNA mismatch endonuclease (patch repair protein)